MLQAQKLIELEGIMGAKAEAEEEPEGKTLVGSGREALRPPGRKIISFLINCLSFWVYLDSSPLFVVFLHWELFGHQVSLKRMRERWRSPRCVPQSRLSSIWPTLDCRREVHLYWLRTKLKGYLLRYLVFPGLSLSYFSSVLFLCPGF